VEWRREEKVEENRGELSEMGGIEVGGNERRGDEDMERGREWRGKER
jgi:hypothetical protein